MQEARLKLEDVVLDLTNHIEELGAGGGVGIGQLLRLDAEGIRLELHLVELLSVMQGRREPLIADVSADAARLLRLGRAHSRKTACVSFLLAGLTTSESMRN